MNQPLALDIPHTLGKAGVRARIDSRIGQVASAVPGGAIVEKRWDGDTFHFTVSAMGQRVASTITAFEDHVHAVVDLPLFLLPFAGMVRGAIEQGAPKLLK